MASPPSTAGSSPYQQFLQMNAPQTAPPPLIPFTQFMAIQHQPATHQSSSGKSQMPLLLAPFVGIPTAPVTSPSSSQPIYPNKQSQPPQSQSQPVSKKPTQATSSDDEDNTTSDADAALETTTLHRKASESSGKNPAAGNKPTTGVSPRAAISLSSISSSLPQVNNRLSSPKL